LTSCKPVSCSRRTLHRGESKWVFGMYQTKKAFGIRLNANNKTKCVAWVLIWFRIGSRDESLKMRMCFFSQKIYQNVLQGFLSSEIWYCIHGSPGPNPSKHEGVMFPRNIGILLPTEAASYPRRGPVLHRWENLKTEVMSSLAKRLTYKRYWDYYLLYRVIRNDCRGFNNCHLVLQMQPHVISFYGVTSRTRFMFLLFPQVSRNWRYESEPPL